MVNVCSKVIGKILKVNKEDDCYNKRKQTKLGSRIMSDFLLKNLPKGVKVS